MGNPFPGLRPFREDEEYLFFGRERQVDTMIDKIAVTRFLAVVGTSGSGKSSLVNCGLRPALHQGLMANAGTSWRMAQFRPGSNPLRAMARALAKDGVLFKGFESGLPLDDMIEATLRMSKLGLVDVCEQAQLGQGVNLLVVVDQFEELFRYQRLGAFSANDGQDRSQECFACVNLLLEARANANLPIYIVLTMRSDFLGECAQFPGLPEAINGAQYLVPRMTRDERRAAIAGPVKVARGEISSVLLTRLVNDVGDNPDQLSILQHALNRTCAQWLHDGHGEGPLSLPHYEAIGTMAHALDQHAEEAYGELGSERQQKICEKLFRALTDRGTDSRGIRRPTSFAKLCVLTGSTAAEVTAVIDAFREPSRSFLMPPQSEVLEPDTVIDISHESLMRVWERLKVWADEEAQSAQFYHRISETAALHEVGKAGLWQDPDLQLALDWWKREGPTQAWAERYYPGFERASIFLEKSRAARDAAARAEETRRRRSLQRTRLVALLVGVAALVSFAFGLFAVNQRKRAEKAAEYAETQRKIATAQEGIAKAREGEAMAQTAIANSGRIATAALLNRDDDLDLASLLSVEASRTAETFDAHNALLWTLQSDPSLLTYLHHSREVEDVAFSPNGRILASANDDGTIRFWDVASRRPLGSPIKADQSRVDKAVFSPDGKVLASSSYERVRLWDVASRRPIGEPFKRRGCLVFSPNGKVLALGDNQAIQLWDMVTLGPLGEPFKEDACVVFSPDGKTLASAGQKRVIRLLDIASRELLWETNVSPASSVAFSPDGKTLASAGYDQTVRLWDVASGKALGEPLKGHTGVVSSVAFSPDGKILASGSDDQTIWLWDVGYRQPRGEVLD
jgi:dipeptidyl aminopeptidase/acylaminoacyl peptidase